MSQCKNGCKNKCQKDECKNGGCQGACEGHCKKDGCNKENCKKNSNEKNDHKKSDAQVCTQPAQPETNGLEPGSREYCMECSHVVACMVRELTGFGPDLRHLGLPRKRAARLTSWKVKEIFSLREDGMTHRQIAADVDISASYVCKVLAHGSLEKALMTLSNE